VAEIYANSMVKVARFCLSWKIAGFSSAAGTNLQERIDIIMTNTVRKRVTLPQRMLVGMAMLAAIFITVATGLARVGAAQEHAPQPMHEIPIEDRKSTPSPEEEPSLEMMRRLYEQAARVAFRSIKFENEPGAPIVITEAKAKFVQAQG